jgi:uncharacterized protein (TIGR02452 family)
MTISAIKHFNSCIDIIYKAHHLSANAANRVKAAFEKAMHSQHDKLGIFHKSLVALQHDKKIHLTAKNVAIIESTAKKCLIATPQKKPQKPTPAPWAKNTQLIKVFSETKMKLKTMPKSIIEPMQKRTILQKSPPRITHKLPITHTRVEFLATDTIEAALKIQQKTKKSVAALNMANAYSPGGGVEKGTNAQEKDLFRKTALSYSLYPTINPHLKKQLGGGPYRIPEVGTIYTPNVPVIRHKNNLIRKQGPYPHISFISAAAPNFKHGIPKNYESLMKEKIRSVLRTTHQFHEIPLLSAWGCGAFGNNPHTVARLFKEVLQEKEFKNIFPKIYFAITPGKNFAIFSQILQN